MAMGKAVVSTTIGAEGLAVRHEEEILLADTPAAMAAALVRLWDDAALRRRLEPAARALAEQRYDWNVIGQELEGAYREACEQPAASGSARGGSGLG